MPFYDYVCQACGRRIEVMHGVHATGPERCDVCGGRMQRVISRPSIHFKGSGWAKMDARAHTATGGGGRESNGPAADASGGDSAAKGDGATKDDGAAKHETSDQAASGEGGAEATPASKPERRTPKAPAPSRDEA